MGMAMARLNKLFQKQAKGRPALGLPKLNMAPVAKPNKVVRVDAGNKTYCLNFAWSDDHHDYINTQLNCTLARYNKHRYR